MEVTPATRLENLDRLAAARRELKATIRGDELPEGLLFGTSAEHAAAASGRHTGRVIDVGLARQLKEAGLRWEPQPGDRFAIPEPELLGQVFTIAELTIDVQRLPSGPVLAFNGTTEWALDSVPAGEVVWLPAEHQLRGLLGGCFRHLRATHPGASGHADGETSTAAGYEVAVVLQGDVQRLFHGAVADDAYARALLELLRLVAS